MFDGYLILKGHVVVNIISYCSTSLTAAGVDPLPLPVFGFRFFSFLAQRSPHALQSVFGPLGPFRHSGESSVPNYSAGE